VLIRTIVTALNLFVDRRGRVFTPGALDDALEYIGASGAGARRILETVEQFRRELNL
jgi:hypothetical protein